MNSSKPVTIQKYEIIANVLYYYKQSAQPINIEQQQQPNSEVVD